ncbi:peroxiredoxin [Sulfitobacter aestuarii]|uniref:thioredoxin-dependent peroxiredoxin n=1 Tax=Sulfitobacter aestuarii TaxID=2161676 RepID=A0ABW5U5Q9_9RHOB
MSALLARTSAAEALVGQALPALRLAASDGRQVDLARLDGTNVLYCYPPDPAAGAAQASGFRDLHAALRHLGVDRVIGVSAQSPAAQRVARERLALPFHLLSDGGALLARAFGIFDPDGSGIMSPRHLTLILRNGRITDVIDPAGRAGENAQDVLDLLTGN